MSKTCEYCQSEFSPSRKDARFCTSTCKSKYWYNKKCEQTEEVELQNEFQSSLKGVIDETMNQTLAVKQDDFEIVQVKRETMAYKNIKQKQTEMLNQKILFEKRIKHIQNDIATIKNSNGFLLTATCTGVGGILADTKFKNPTKNIVGAALGFVAGSLINESMAERREKEKRQAIAQKEDELQNAQKNLNIINNNLNIIANELASITRYVIEEVKQPRKKAVLSQNVLLGLLPKPEIQKPEPFVLEKPQTLKQLPQTKSTKSASERIISSFELAKHDYKALHFTDEWQQFIGYPSINFQCAIHGRAGEGKSTFAIQFAMYLAENFGRVIYISSEEGFSKTFKDKFVRNNALSENLFVADLNSYDEIKKEIPVDAYHFIFIDSLNNMRIDAEILKQLRERYKNSSIITISQATKDGKMRGSYEIIHDVDIEIIVTKGVAMTNKNRFKEKELEMRVF